MELNETESPENRDTQLLTARQMKVFRKIMDYYIQDAGPVGSRKVAKDFQLSAATIRNIMADLEDMGLLEQPHVSAGRTPTDAGYRFYVDNCVNPNRTAEEIGPETRQSISRTFNNRDELERVMHQASQLLSRLTNYAGLVIAPRVKSLICQRIQFVRVNEFRILAIFVAKNGMVRNKLIVTDEDYTQELLDSIARMLNERFADRTLREIRAGVATMLEEDRRKYDRLLDSAARLGQLAVNRDLNDREDRVYIEGTFNILDLPEFKDLSRLKELFKTFTERTAMVSLLDRCLEEEGVSVAIGAETAIPEIRDMSVVTARYQFDEDTAGGLGVIGPKRMPYKEVIALVSYMASVMSLLLKNWDEPNLNMEEIDP